MDGIFLSLRSSICDKCPQFAESAQNLQKFWAKRDLLRQNSITQSFSAPTDATIESAGSELVNSNIHGTSECFFVRSSSILRQSAQNFCKLWALSANFGHALCKFWEHEWCGRSIAADTSAMVARVDGCCCCFCLCGVVVLLRDVSSPRVVVSAVTHHVYTINYSNVTLSVSQGCSDQTALSASQQEATEATNKHHSTIHSPWR